MKGVKESRRAVGSMRRPSDLRKREMILAVEVVIKGQYLKSRAKLIARKIRYEAGYVSSL